VSLKYACKTECGTFLIYQSARYYELSVINGKGDIVNSPTKHRLFSEAKDHMRTVISFVETMTTLLIENKNDPETKRIIGEIHTCANSNEEQ